MKTRAMLHAYLRSQAAHKIIHKITQAFEQDSSDVEILKRIEAAQQLLEEAEQLIREQR